MKSYRDSFEIRYIKRMSEAGSAGSAGRSISQLPEETIKKEYEIVLHFLQQKDVPQWFRGGSRFQLEAAFSLFNAIRDDSEQSTTHRVRKCLAGLGLQPIPPNKDLKLLMRLSRGNDLAFLWFLMEMHYKISDTKYSVNEQIVLSVIAHLDMVTTMRELDRILPPGNPSRKVLERQENLAKEKKREEKERLRTATKLRKKYILPYFEPLKRKRAIVKPVVHMPHFKVKFGFDYKNPNFVVINESNRWFADYNLSEGKRIVNTICKDEIAMMFENMAEKQKRKIDGGTSDEAIHTTGGDNNENAAKSKRVLCTHHTQEEMRKELASKMEKVQKLNKCIDGLDPGNSYNEKIKHKLFLDQFEQYIESYRKTLARKDKPIEKQNQVNVIGKNCFCEYLINDEKNDENEENEEACLQPDLFISINEQGEVERLSGGCDCESSRKQLDDLSQAPIIVVSGKNDSDSRESSSGSVQWKLSHSIHRMSRERFFEQLPIGRIAKERNSSGRFTRFLTKVTPISSKEFFKSPHEHKPFEFDYRKIFEFNFTDNKRLKLKQLYLDALDCDEKNVKKLPDSTPDIMDAVNKCAKKTWKDLQCIQKQMDYEQEQLSKEEAKAEKGKKDWVYNFSDFPKIPAKDWYDCEDSELMATMLREALKYMSKNRKFVLASMQDAWKLPFLREWIYQRYGKKYSLQERIKLFRDALKIFKALSKLQVKVATPSVKNIGNNSHLDYSCRDNVSAKCEHFKNIFYDRMNNVIMEDARVFWFAMRPYICSNGPPRDTYYSYMPSRVADIHHFRPWNRRDFMDAKTAWDKRQRLKRST